MERREPCSWHVLITVFILPGNVFKWGDFMLSKVRRIFVEKRKGYNIEARSLYEELKEYLGIKGLEDVRVLNRYDISGITDEEYARARDIIFSEPPVDLVYDEVFPLNEDERVFALEYLPGQFDQRADSAAQCVQILTQRERPDILSAKVIILKGDITDEEFEKVKGYCINPIECREASPDKPSSLEMETAVPDDVQILEGFNGKTPTELQDFSNELGLAMSFDDLVFCQEYFRNKEEREPTITEIRVIDTYWSDHCRHTTFLTKIEDVKIEKGRYSEPIEKAYDEYLVSRNYVYGSQEKDICLMDIALMGMKELRKKGLLQDLDESDEINACSIVVNAEINGKNEEWLVMFKNETHNHPTEIEPFGGAATCLGGAIRDPLSGRSYVYQAMRVTGCADPRAKVEDTLPGKLPQRKITTLAAAGYSSYGNQIGLPTGQVTEIYDQGFLAKRMELGAVIGAAPRDNVVREKPAPGDLVLLVGGRTGRDGCGGATGSSKEHTVDSLFTCGAEVQKGNAPTERNLQRLFRNPAVSRMIKKCNDFGAGGVSVAVGELAAGLDINLDAVPKKYAGLDGTELAISESQERMAVVVAPGNLEAFTSAAARENLEATPIARVIAERRLKMSWRGKPIVDISRDFLDTSGVKQKTRVAAASPVEDENYFDTLPNAIEKRLPDLKEAWLANLKDLNVCSQIGLVERFDSTVGASTVLLPLGGKYQATPAEGMVAKLPVLSSDTRTATIMTFGYNPALASWSPFHGALYAVIEAVTKAVALGADYRSLRLTLQEYFEKLGQDPSRWGKPFSALLGAFYAQKKLGIPAIGGKDSMSGTFMDLHVPPTLVAFAVGVVDAERVVSGEFKSLGSKVVLLPVTRDEKAMPDFYKLGRSFAKVTELINSGAVLSSCSVRIGGLAAAVSRMAFGNRIGMSFTSSVGEDGLVALFRADYGSLILELDGQVDLEETFGDVDYRLLGYTVEKPAITLHGTEIGLDEAYSAWEEPLSEIFPTRTASLPGEPREIAYTVRNTHRPKIKKARPLVFIPVFPGTNCEYDLARAFQRAGGEVETLVIKNLTPADVDESIREMARRIGKAQIVAIPGGFSAGDEPDGSGKFIAVMFRNPLISEAVMKLLKERDGLMLGICNGFHALIKLGLVPYGEIVERTPDSPTLTFNRIGRHVSRQVRTKVVSTLSPWFNNVEAGAVHTLAVSHGEGRFVAPDVLIKKLIRNGQICTQYVDFDGKPSNDIHFNPNGSDEAVEGITSPDGRVLGKMAHSERIGRYVAVNVPGEKDQRIFEAGINYFR